MFNIEMLQADRIAAANIAAHRNRELERRQRIFNSKVRTIGVDQIGLKHQVKEKNEKAESEKHSLHVFAAGMLHDDKVARLLEVRQLKESRLLEQQALDGCRHCSQQPRRRRERDPNDPGVPGWLQMTLPGLLGEDPGSKARTRRQKEQLGDWSRQQHQELEAARHQQKVADEQYNQSRINVDRKALQLQEIQLATKKALAHATRDFNLAKAAEDRERHRQAKQRIEEDKHQADVLSHIQADRELEASRDTALQAARQRIHFNLHQVEEKTRSRCEKQLEQELEERLHLDSARRAVLLERQQSRTLRMQRRELDHANAQLAQAHGQQKKTLEMEFSGAVDDSYFSKFNASSR